MRPSTMFSEINESPVMVEEGDELSCNRVGDTSGNINHDSSNLDKGLINNTFEENDPWVKKNIN